MSLNLQSRPNTSPLNGLAALVQQIEVGGVASLGHCWQEWFAGAAEQLETDDSLDARLTDALADTLAEAEDAICGGYDSGPALRHLVSLYYRNQQSIPLETLWRNKARDLGMVQLETRTWEDLHKALDAAAAGRHCLVGKWIDSVEATFLTTWEGYQSGDILAEEITAESVLGHSLLREGVEGWLAALGEFRRTLQAVDRAAVLALAEQGQRLLLAVQIMEQEAQDSVGRFLAAWSN